MKASQLKETLAYAIKNKLPVLIKGAPGTGKSDLVAQACHEAGADLIISHPVVSDPTDYKGLPFPVADKDEATFLPFGDLLRLIRAEKPTVFFLDDLGQAPASVQSAVMQLILARRVNGHSVSEHVVFLAATNRREDKAGVMGILEPVKSRFAAIVELEVDVDDWVTWAFREEMPAELIAFIRYRPHLLHDFKPTADIVNTPSPRTVAYVGTMMKNGLPEDLTYELIAGAAGEGFATELIGFLNIFRDLPDIPTLIKNPEKAVVPEELSLLFAICGALVQQANRKNFGHILSYAERIPPEFQVLLVNDAQRRNQALSSCPAFAQWAIDHYDIVF